VKVESKEEKFEMIEPTLSLVGSDDLGVLSGPDCLIPAESPPLLKGETSVAMLKLFRSPKKVLLKSGFPMRFATVLTMSSNGSGDVNSVINVNTLNSVASFTAMAAVFQEFFVKGMRVTWMPVSYSQVLKGGAAGTNQQSRPMIAASIQHGSSAYPTDLLAAINDEARIFSTGMPFKYRWKNIESPASTTLPSPVASAVPIQAWCQTVSIAAGAYTGLVQFISTASAGGLQLPVSAALGQFLVEYDVLLRQRT